VTALIDTLASRRDPSRRRRLYHWDRTPQNRFERTPAAGSSRIITDSVSRADYASVARRPAVFRLTVRVPECGKITINGRFDSGSRDGLLASERPMPWARSCCSTRFPGPQHHSFLAHGSRVSGAPCARCLSPDSGILASITSAR